MAACAVVYANGVTGAFTYDDKAVVRDNPRIRSPFQVGEIFTTSYFGGPRGTGSAYRPLLLLSYAVGWWIHGENAVAFHIVNILIHAGVALLLLSLLEGIGVAPTAALIASLLFAVHPIHVEAVTSLVGRGETLSTLFVLLYLHVALRLWRRPPDSQDLLPRLRLHVRGAVTYAAALLTKESGAIAPALTFLLFVFLAQGGLLTRLWTALRRGLTLYAVSTAELFLLFRLRAWILGGALRSSSSGIFEVENALAPLPAVQRMGNACLLLLRYLGRCVFPLHLSGDESAWSIRPLPVASAWTAGAVLLIVLLLAAALARLKRRSLDALGFLFFFVATLPTGNLLFPIGTIFAERLAYLPSAGICLILGSLLAAQTEGALSPRRRWAILTMTLLFSARAIVRNAVWWSDEGLFANLVATASQSAKAHYDVAYVAADEGRYSKARDEYGRAVAIYHGYWDAWAGKGRVEKQLGLLDDAERSYQQSIDVNLSNENGYFGLGLVREARHDDAGAAAAYRQGLDHVPNSLPLAYRLALAAGRLRLPTASEDWDRAIRLGAHLCSVRSDYARWLSSVGRENDARGQTRLALRRDSRCADAWRLSADMAQESGRRLSRALALEKAYRASRSAADLAALEQVARDDPMYARRFALWRPKSDAQRNPAR